MNQPLPQTISLLERTPAALDALLRGLPEFWTLGNEGDGTWNAVEIVGHLIDCERTNWMPRVKFLLQFGESRAFEPFDRGGHTRERQGKSMEQVLDEFMNEFLDEFTRVRQESLAALRSLDLQPVDLERRGRHPSFGSVTLAELMATWAAHDLTHLHQISRVLAFQYRDAVGPWIRYLGVLQCTGRSAPA
jgi:hypothetical protein